MENFAESWWRKWDEDDIAEGDISQDFPHRSGQMMQIEFAKYISSADLATLCLSPARPPIEYRMKEIH